MRIKLIFFTFFLALACGCDRDPAQSVKILHRPPVPEDTFVKPASLLNWHPEACPPRPEGSKGGPSSLTVSGPCPFSQSGAVKCLHAGDDLFIDFNRVGRGDARVTVHLNVEYYHGPGTYDKSIMVVMVEEAKTHRWYRWSSDKVTATVGPDVAFVELPKTPLDGEPLKIHCNKDFEKGSKQFHCDPVLDSLTLVENTTEVAAGKLRCLK